MDDGSYRITAGPVERTIEVRDGVAATVSLGLLDVPARVRSAQELTLVLDAADWRHDIPTWRWREADDPGAGWTEPAFDDAGWRVVPHLHPVITARAAAPSSFRTWVTVPESVRGAPITVVLGGLDGQDWTEYEAWLDGQPLDRWAGTGTIREPRRSSIQPGTPAYAALRFGTPMLLAVRCAGLTRTHPDLVPGELEHHFFADWLVDQAVVAGPVDRVVDSLQVIGSRSVPDRSLELELASADGTVVAEVAYRADGEVIRKHVRVVNRTDRPITLLDAVLDRWEGDLGAAYGGRGQPATMGGVFAGVEHPAGVTRVAPGRVDLVQMPGVTIAPGAAWDAAATVIGGSAAAPVDEAFRQYVLGLRARPERRVKVYSALGWYDFTNPADPLPELTEELVEENLGRLREVADAGARFDVYMLDDWWDWNDLGRFRPHAFPSGAQLTRDRIEAEGMRMGLWWATTRAVWSARDRVGMDAAVANAPDAGAPLDLAGGEWRWLEEFTNLMIGERRFCLAAEPYRSHALTSLPAMVRETHAAMFKLDCAVLHCTASDHGHRPGRHSTEAMATMVMEVIAAAREASPDLRAVLYWGFRSPWWLGHADATFDKGLLMEAATVASIPGRTIRHSLSTNVDQAIRHARFIPRRLQDSLGVWIGDVAWCNRIGKDEWAEALLVDLARGADMVQLWGDLTLFDDLDRRSLGDIIAWFDRSLATAREPRLIGGDPWLGEPYGYVTESAAGEVATLVNPGPVDGAIGSLPGVSGFAAQAWQELYPTPGGVTAGEDVLAPFEVRVLARGTRRPNTAREPRKVIHPTRRLNDVIPITASDTATHWAGSIPLGTIGRDDEIHVSVRLRRGEDWAYQPDPSSIVRIAVTLDGMAVRSDLIPRTRDRNGPGSPWVLLRIPAGPAWSDRSLNVEIAVGGAPGLTIEVSSSVVHAWWRGPRRFGT